MKCDDPFKVICPFDPAIDDRRCSFADAVAYGRSRKWEDIERFLRPEPKPMVFHLRPIAASLKDWVASASADSAPSPERNERAFAAACFQVDHLWNVDGTRVMWTAQGADRPDTMLTDAERDRFDYVVRQDIGCVAAHRLLFLVRWSAPEYLLPHGSGLLLAQRYLSESSADASQENSTQPATDSSSRQSVDSATATGSGAEQSDAPTAVRATG